jgi:hypothetical protein
MAITPLACILEVLDSSPDRDTDYPGEIFNLFPQSRQTNRGLAAWSSFQILSNS